MNDSPPQLSPRARLIWPVFMVSLCFLSLIGMVITLWPHEPDFLEESLLLPVNRQVSSVNHYKNWVWISISGRGQIDDNTSHSPFAAFPKDSNGQIFSGFRIDGQIVHTRLLIPIPTPIPVVGTPGVFKFRYYVGETARPIVFEIDNGNLADTSVFTVDISDRAVFSTGR